MALLLKPLIQAKAKENQKTSTGGTKPQLIQNSGKAEKISTDKELAKIAGVSHDTIFKVEQIQKKASEEIKQKVKDGELSIRQGYETVRPISKPNDTESKEEGTKKCIKCGRTKSISEFRTKQELGNVKDKLAELV